MARHLPTARYVHDSPTDLPYRSVTSGHALRMMGRGFCPLPAIRWSRVLPLQQCLRAIDIIKKRHFSSRVLWSFIVLATPARCLTDGAELRPA